MHNTILFLLVSFLILGCLPEQKNSANRFKQGVFEIPSGDNYSKTILVRKDSLQIETYTKKISKTVNGKLIEINEQRTDTLFITWRNDFSYRLNMKSPKTDLDKDPIFVQINEVADSSYSFTAKIGYSNFKQKGTVYISPSN